MSESLHDRLRRGRAAEPPGSPPPRARGDGLDAPLLLEEAAGGTLKERLERLVAAACRRDRTRPRAVPLEDLVPGRVVRNASGEFFLVEGDVHLDVFHGNVTLSRFRALDPARIAILTGDPGFSGFDLSRAVFLDTETTGLAGGTGTAAFLVGVGFVDGDRFRVRQYFMRDYSEEPALFEALSEDLRPFEHLVTFNGKMFDVPLLESRYRLNRGSFPLGSAKHLDLLHPARRLWKARLECCRLQSLEIALLGLRRSGDVPGEDIPRIYFEYLRSRDARGVAGILEHNRLDVVSLAALSALSCQWLEEGFAEDPRDVFSLARVYERAGLHERSLAAYRRVLREGEGPVLVKSLLRLAVQAKREGDHEAALALFERAAGAGDWLALREVAVHHEHRSRDYAAALGAVEKGLALTAERVPHGRVAREFRRRHARLRSKMSRPQA